MMELFTKIITVPDTYTGGDRGEELGQTPLLEAQLIDVTFSLLANSDCLNTKLSLPAQQQ